MEQSQCIHCHAYLGRHDVNNARDGDNFIIDNIEHDTAGAVARFGAD